MKKIFALAISAFILAGCGSLPGARTLDEQKSYIDKTVSVPNRLFMETPESKSVLLGSGIFAQAAGCQYLKRYKIRTTASFTESLNLLKYRAALMGAKRLTIVKHEELDASEGRVIIRDDDAIYLEMGTSLEGAAFHTTIIADLFDCPSAK